MLEQYKKYKATIKIRRDLEFDVSESAEQFDGKDIIVMCGWQIEDDHNIYPNEYAMIATKETREMLGESFKDFSWIASGDLINIEEYETTT